MSHLGEDAEAFFQKGDEGTYDGGPKSLTPATHDIAQEGDELATEVTPELLERRGRFQRMVKTVVGALGAAVLVLLPFRLGSAGGSTNASAATGNEPATPAVTTVSVAEPASTHFDPAPSTPPSLAEPGSVQSTSQAVAAPGHAMPAATKHPVRRSAVHALRAPRSGAAIVRAATSPTHGVLRTPAGTNTPTHVTASRRASSVHVPPTASFPD